MARKATVALALAGSLIIAVIAAPARAQNLPYDDKCNDAAGERSSIEEQIAGCTAAISSGRYDGKGLVLAYITRGQAWQDKGDLDRAIADFDQAIRLDPSSLPSYFAGTCANRTLPD